MMAIVNDWTLDAASEIVDDMHGDYPGSYEENIRDVSATIAKHSPFKEDVAYMPVPRCEACALWTPRVDLDAGRCGLREMSGAKLWPEMYDGIITTKDFGCVQWKEKP